MLVNGKQQFLCEQLPNVMFLYIILHMAVKLSRHGCQCFAQLPYIDGEKYHIKVYMNRFQNKPGLSKINFSCTVRINVTA